jgi:Resolvase, N terminal domain/Recombinase
MRSCALSCRYPRGEGWNLVALDLGLDLSTTAGKRIATALMLAAEWERRLRSERTREALARRRAEGKRLGTPRRAPAETLAKIRRLRAQGKSLQAIAEELNRLCIPTARGGSQWRPSSVASVLSRVPKRGPSRARTSIPGPAANTSPTSAARPE